MRAVHGDFVHGDSVHGDSVHGDVLSNAIADCGSRDAEVREREWFLNVGRFLHSSRKFHR